MSVATSLARVCFSVAAFSSKAFASGPFGIWVISRTTASTTSGMPEGSGRGESRVPLKLPFWPVRAGQPTAPKQPFPILDRSYGS